MKKVIILCIFLATCNHTYVADAQNKNKSAAQLLEDARNELRKSRDSTKTIVTAIRQLANQKIIYRTKIIEHTDTVWRIDTCIRIITPIDSATIAIMFQNRDTPKVTTRGKKILFIFRKKNKN